MSRDRLERHQVWWYLAALLVGLGLGSRWDDADRWVEPALWPLLALLLYATFTQLPLGSLGAAFADRRFLVTALAGNFVVVPALVAALLPLTPDDPMLRFGLVLVLVVPCTDWFITFAQLGRADAVRATAFAPVSLLVQLMLLPAYLWLLTDVDLGVVVPAREVWPAVLVVLVPLVLAVLTVRVGRGGAAGGPREAWVERLGWWPVPLLATVILAVATANVGAVRGSLDVLAVVGLVAGAYLALALGAARLLATLVRLPLEQGRTLAFTMGTRNSFIVLPLALALPAGWEIVPIVVVTQSLVELLAMIVYVWLVPQVVFADRPASA
ncbi:arsenic resistance protein [Aeromicrobium halocynthiae]|uniref:Arsenic resistance protein n=1 Tax=Aeromicrobium halocynthiae TaxID=560557 RepID=A0ABP5HHB3_9ACTN